MDSAKCFILSGLGWLAICIIFWVISDTVRSWANEWVKNSVYKHYRETIAGIFPSYAITNRLSARIDELEMQMAKTGKGKCSPSTK